MMSRRASRGLVASLVLATGACSAEPPDAPAPPAPPAPTLVAAVPASGAVRIATDAELRLTFSVPMDAQQVQEGLQLSTAAGEAIPIFVATVSEVVTVTPRAPLAELTTHVLTIPSTVTSQEGGELAEALTVEFRTAGMARIVPEIGEVEVVGVACDGAFEFPEEFAGAEGLEAVGWSYDDLVNQVAWNLPFSFERPWISDNTDQEPSVRVRPQLAPLAGHCFVRAVSEDGRPRTLQDILTAQSAFSHPSTPFGELVGTEYASPAYDLGIDDPLIGAIWGLYELDNDLPGAPELPPWSDVLQADLQSQTSGWPMSVREALAKLVLSVGEAFLLKRAAMAGVDDEVWGRIHAELIGGAYSNTANSFFNPSGGTFVADVLSSAEMFDVAALARAAQGLSAATEGVRAALAAAGPVDGQLDVATPHGRVVIDLSSADSLRDAADLDGIAVLVDAGGNDRYEGQYASTPAFWMSASVVLDAGAGADFHNLRMASLENRGIRPRSAFDPDYLATQGAGVFGVGLLVDGGGPDQYQASVLTQGSGAFGVGALVDHGGDDVYRGTYLAQGLGYFGIGVLLDVSGADRYVVGGHGQGVGRPGGHGLLVDGDGSDEYLAIHVADPPELAGDYAHLFPSGYARDGVDHNMNVAQGVGWGFRGDWFDPERSWAGGMGALVDLGAGDDLHLGDCMVMGQGFVYGYGLLYDGGGDDRYRNFWWGIGSGTHMGTGVLLEAGGDDDYFTTRASSGLGHDTGVAWFVDHAGDDRYGGQMTFGRALQGGLAFFLELGGADVYATDAGRVNFGVVQIVPFSNLPRIGVFMDLGGGDDVYPEREDIGNDRAWYQAPVGDNVDPDVQKGVGLDK